MSADNTIEKALDSQIAVKAARLRKLEAALGVAREDLTAARRHIVETDDTIAAQRATLRDLDARETKLAAMLIAAIRERATGKARSLAFRCRDIGENTALDKARTEFARAQAELAKLEGQ